MKSKKYSIIIISMIATRMLLSLIISDGIVRSDSISYLGLVVNIVEHKTFTAIVPLDENKTKNGMTVDALYHYHSTSDSPYRRLMKFQWFHSLLYAPFIVLFKSLYAVIVINNILFACAGLVLLGIVRSAVQDVWRLSAYGFFLFFPPFFYITNQFWSEPLFIFLIAVITSAVVQSKRLGLKEIIVLIALSITRGFGLFILAGYIVMCIVQKQYRSAVVMTFCGIASMIINSAVGANSSDPSRITIPSPPPLIHSVYFSNTIYGNGDNDYFLTYPDKLDGDEFFRSYKEGITGNGELFKELFRQNISAPSIFFNQLFNKTTAYFLNIIPDSWNYLGTTPQPLFRKIAWGLQNIAFLSLLAAGWKKSTLQYRKYYSIVFILSFVIHFVALARYRYFFPALVLSLPVIAVAFQFYLGKGIAIIFKKQNAPG